MSIMEISGSDVADASHWNFRGMDGVSKSDARENCDLVTRIKAVNVEGWIGFSIAGCLRLLQRLAEPNPALLHLRQDVVAGAVQNSVNRLDAVSGQRLRNGADYRDTSSNAGFNANGKIFPAGQRKQFFSMLSDEGFVGSNYSFALLQAGADDVVRNTGSTDGFNHDINIAGGDD